jgi:hypothetical protein
MKACIYKKESVKKEPSGSTNTFRRLFRRDT